MSCALFGLHNYTSEKQIHVHLTFRLERNEAWKKTENRKSIKNGLHSLSLWHNKCLCLFGAKAKTANNRNCFCLIEQYLLKSLIALYNSSILSVFFRSLGIELLDNGWLRLIPFSLWSITRLPHQSFRISDLKIASSVEKVAHIIESKQIIGTSHDYHSSSLPFLLLIISCVQCHSSGGGFREYSEISTQVTK